VIAAPGNVPTTGARTGSRTGGRGTDCAKCGVVIRCMTRRGRSSAVSQLPWPMFQSVSWTSWCAMGAPMTRCRLLVPLVCRRRWSRSPRRRRSQPGCGDARSLALRHRRHARSRSLLFHTLLRQAIVAEPVTYKSLRKTDVPGHPSLGRRACSPSLDVGRPELPWRTQVRSSRGHHRGIEWRFHLSEKSLLLDGA
jgi:hypothetical protein